MTLVLKKTDLGLSEISHRTKSLSIIERRALILMDGVRKLQDIKAQLGYDVYPIALRLLNLGMVVNTPYELTARQPPTMSYVWREGFYAKSRDVLSNHDENEERIIASALELSEFVNQQEPRALRKLSFSAVMDGKKYLDELVGRLLDADHADLHARIQQIWDTESLSDAYDNILLSLIDSKNAEAQQELVEGYARVIGDPVSASDVLHS